MPIPVVLDTDIGFDVDDVWALAFLLKCPEVDIKLITTATGDTGYRALLVAKLLKLVGREDIPIGVGIPLDASPKTHAGWLADFDLSDYRGDVLRDGIGAMCDTIAKSSEQVELVCIGPLPNIAAALSREPEIASNARFVGMHGSVRRGYLGADKPMREYNVRQHALSCQAAFAASWQKVITPLDTCGTIALEGERFARLKESDDPLTRAVLDIHFDWFEAVREWPNVGQMDSATRTSILYDTVAVYLAFSEANLVMEEIALRVTDDGKTMEDPTGHMVRCAMDWTDKDAFLDFVTERLGG
ncbi:MAG: nucleoside hydrolase [Pseudomonadota bacterium]